MRAVHRPSLGSARTEVKRSSQAARLATVVLVVEDDFLIRLYAVTIIEEAGYRVLEASNADEAIHILQARNDIRCRSLPTSTCPARRTRMKLARLSEVAGRRSNWILTSGRYAIGSNSLPERGRFLAKPYSEAAVLTAIDSIH